MSCRRHKIFIGPASPECPKIVFLLRKFLRRRKCRRRLIPAGRMNLQCPQNSGGFMGSDSGARLRAPSLFWRDVFGAVHLCERSDVRQAFYLFSTLCGRNVPPNARWPSLTQGGVSCPECARLAAAPGEAASLPARELGHDETAEAPKARRTA
jgi:hypothetical protein